MIFCLIISHVEKMLRRNFVQKKQKRIERGKQKRQLRMGLLRAIESQQMVEENYAQVKYFKPSKTMFPFSSMRCSLYDVSYFIFFVFFSSYQSEDSSNYLHYNGTGDEVVDRKRGRGS